MQRRDQPHREVDVPGGHRALERRTQVVGVGHGPLDPRPLVGPLHATGRPARPARRSARHGAWRAIRPRAGAPARRRAGSPAPGTACRRYRSTATTIDLSTSAVSRSRVSASVVSGSPHTAWTAVDPGTAREHRQPREQPLLRLGQQPVGPVDRGGEALVAGLRATGAAGEQVPVVEAAGHLRRAHRPHPRGGQLDRERQAVEPAADLGDRALDLAVGVEVRPGGAGTLHEQRGGVGGGHRGQRPDLLALDAERLAARGEHDDAGAVRHHAIEQPRRGVEHVLAVVQHEQQRARPRGTRSPSARSSGRAAAARAARSRRPGSPGRRRPAAPARRATPRRGTAPAPRPATSSAVRDFPTPPTPVRVTSGADRSAAAIRAISESRPTKLVPRRGRFVGGPGAPDAERGVVRQQLPVHGPGRLRRFHAQLVDEQAPQVPVHGQGVGLPAAAVQRPHQQHGQPLPLGIPAHERGQLGDDLAAAAEQQHAPRRVPRPRRAGGRRAG